MHMADALLSPAIGGAMTAVTLSIIGYSLRKISNDNDFDEKNISLMGVMGAFVFAAQMINFTIPGTGSSGHIGGGILLAAILGPYPALLTMTIILLIQALFFADGGLLALGCNIFNMGVCACMFGYCCVFRPFIKGGLNAKKITAASILSTVLGLQLGALCVVLETFASGVTELPFSTFLLLMQPIHLAIGFVEGVVTSMALCYVYKARPEILEHAKAGERVERLAPMKKLVVTFALLTLLAGCCLSLFASSYPDGLEWSMERVAGTAELVRSGAVYDVMDKIIGATAFMPDYAFGSGGVESANVGTATAGLVGSAIVLVITGAVGYAIAFHRRKNS
ncbi:MAG: energy-coupling factor ABC transporter permease [Synergistaceae bacterium]|nr:energy-coupling factor ABC transporter permease [Synergistaceae bacterium]